MRLATLFFLAFAGTTPAAELVPTRVFPLWDGYDSVAMVVIQEIGEGFFTNEKRCVRVLVHTGGLRQR